jgi:hypothetical protein
VWDETVIEVLSIEHQPHRGRRSSDRSKDKWDENYVDFEACDGMPAKETKEYHWRQTQLSSGHFGLDAKIKKEIEANEGGTVWKDRKARFLD